MVGIKNQILFHGVLFLLSPKISKRRNSAFTWGNRCGIIQLKETIVMFHRYYGVPKDAKYGEKFMARFPILFQERKKSMQETCMCWGIECPRGWYHILEQLCTVLEFHNIEFVKKYNLAIVADQVKEKYGTLRFYFSIRTVDDDGVLITEYDENGDFKSGKLTNKLDENTHSIVSDYLEMVADQYIREAEEMTENTCAKCGIPLDDGNKVETKGWITYLCKECDEKIRNGERFDCDEDEVEEGVYEEPAGKAGEAE